MTLNQLTEVMDAEISRLQKIRAVVATLIPASPESTPAVPSKVSAQPIMEALVETSTVSPEPDTDAAPSAARTLTPRAPRQQRSREVPKTKAAKRAKDRLPTALRGSVPQGPIVVAPADVRARPVPEPKVQAPPVTSGHSLEDLVRQLTHRSSPGLPPRLLAETTN